jgi:hypothetical protein
MESAENPYHIQFAFTLFVTNSTYLSTIGNEDYPIRDNSMIYPLQNDYKLLNVVNEAKAKKIAALRVSNLTAQMAAIGKLAAMSALMRLVHRMDGCSVRRVLKTGFW